jgi:hypothetical protein
MTRVVYRQIVDNPGAGQIIAVFPDDEDQQGFITSYMHIGQHGLCAKEFVLDDTICALGIDSAPLMSELKSQGYDDLKEVSLEEVDWAHKPVCLYCESGSSEHFICSDCGDGMCDSCYDADVEHDGIYQDPAESAISGILFEQLEKICAGGYLCEKCLNKNIKMCRLMEKQV